MFTDVGALELLVLAIVGVLVFGPEKLPKVIQDVTRFIRKIREFSESAKHDIRSELGPEFKDFEFEDLNPKTFIRKQLDGNEDLRDLKELRSSFDLKKEINEVADAVKGKESDTSVPAAGDTSRAEGHGGGSSSTPDLLKKRVTVDKDERPPFDADTT